MVFSFFSPWRRSRASLPDRSSHYVAGRHQEREVTVSHGVKPQSSSRLCSLDGYTITTSPITLPRKQAEWYAPNENPSDQRSAVPD